MKLILEIGTEAIPSGYLAPAIESLKSSLEEGLKKSHLDAGVVSTFATPQRLVVSVDDLAPRQRDQHLQVRGPRKDIAYKDGQPTPPAIGFAKKNGVAVEDLVVVKSEKGEFLEAHVHVAGEAVEAVLPDLLKSAVLGISWPKTMKWNPDGILFPRPIRRILALLDENVLPLEIGGAVSGRLTGGHRLTGAGQVEVKDAPSFMGTLEALNITLDPVLRRGAIKEQINAAAEKLGGQAIGGEELLQEVTYLCEDPTVLTGTIDDAFLEMPREIIVTAMRSHQRYFAVEDAAGVLKPYFLVVCDGRWDDVSTVLAGNERVLRARLADARFYWDVDIKRGLDAMAGDLKSVVWLESLGSMAEKTGRNGRLVAWLGEQMIPTWGEVKAHALRAAHISKADLASEMIKDGKEFTGLQGIMAARYGQALGEAPEVCKALEEQYLPRGVRDPLPVSPAGILLALADRMDTIVGCFSAGLIPSGSQDPYALRRAANGLVRILMEQGHHLDLSLLIAKAISLLPEAAQRDGLEGEVVRFLRERIAYFLRQDGTSHDAVEAVISTGTLDPLDALARARALEAVRGEEDLARLVIGYKRAANILKKLDSKDLPDPMSLDWEKAESAEKDLWLKTATVKQEVEEALVQKDYPAMLDALLTLRAPIDTFFDDVMVMAEDPDARRRRLALLFTVRGLFTNLCDLSRVVLEGENQSPGPQQG